MKPTCYVSEHKELEQRVRDLETTLEEGTDYLRIREQQLTAAADQAERGTARIAELEGRWQAFLFWIGGLRQEELDAIEELRKEGKTFADYQAVEARD